MPALITHYLYAEKVIHTCDAFQSLSPAEKQLIAVGSQGPDPFFFKVLPPYTKDAHKLGSALHHKKLRAAFHEYRTQLNKLTGQEFAYAQAYLRGFLAHYILDKYTHPFIYAQQIGVTEVDPSLKESTWVIHSLIESDIDSAILMHMRHESIDQFNLSSILQAPKDALLLIGHMHKQVARQVYDISISASSFAQSTRDMTLTYKLLGNAHHRRTRLLGKLERCVNKESRMESLGHRRDIDPSHNVMNLSRKLWFNYWHDTVHSDSFYDLFNKAVENYPRLLKVFEEGLDLDYLIEDLNYDGMPLKNDEVCLSPHAPQLH